MNKIALLLAGMMMLIWPCLGLGEKVSLNIYNNSQEALYVIGPGVSGDLSRAQSIKGLATGSYGNEVTLSIRLSKDESPVGDPVLLKFYMFCQPIKDGDPVGRVALGDNCDGAVRFALSQNDEPGLIIRKNLENGDLKLGVLMQLGLKHPTQIYLVLE